MNTPEKPRPGPAPAGKPAWIYSNVLPEGYYHPSPEYIDFPYTWLPAPSAPVIEREKTVEELDGEKAEGLWRQEWGHPWRDIIGSYGVPLIRYGRHDERRVFAKELLDHYMNPKDKPVSFLKLLEEAAKP